MITIEAYRAAIGAFYIKARNDNFNKFSTVTDLPFYYGEEFFNKIFVCFIVTFILYINFHYAFLTLLKLLIDMDVESNPGPTYEILASIKGSFNQSDLRFGYSAGTQCACNALYAICWSVIRKVSLWHRLVKDIYHMILYPGYISSWGYYDRISYQKIMQDIFGK